MASFGGRRGRANRTTSLRIAPSPTAEMFGKLRTRGVAGRLLICLLAVGAMVVAVQGWQLPFPYRLDQRLPHGLAAKTDFQRVNRARTDRARQRAEESVPYFFRHDSQQLGRLPQDLRAAIAPFAVAKSLDELPVDTRTSFGLVVAEPLAEATVPMKVLDRADSFANLKRIVTDDQLLADVLAAFTSFVAPLAERGLLRPEHYPRDMSPADPVAIIDRDGRQLDAEVSQITIIPLLAPAGRLHAAWEKYPVLLSIRSELENFLVTRAPETLTYDDAATQAARQLARQAVDDIPEVYNRGNLLVGPGEPIDETRLAILRAEYEETESRVTIVDRSLRVGVVVLLLGVLAVLIGHYILRNVPQLASRYSRLAGYLGLVLTATAAARALSFDPWRASIAPILAAVMVLAIAYNQVLAVLTAFSLGVVVVVSTSGEIADFSVLMSVCAAAVVLLPSVASRSTVVRVGFAAAGMYLAMYWAMAIIGWGGAIVVDEPRNYVVWKDPGEWFRAVQGAGWCVLAGFIVSGSLPFIENSFGVVTDISLLELGDVSHPLLQELVRRAPGTYNHSMAVATLGETAADRIGANGLLVRVGAYFHDIGKMLKPHYFVENMIAGAENRHNQLAPTMSTLIIIGHVKDGIDLADQHGLPQPLIDLIEQHHGTTLVEYFFHEAAKHLDPDHRTEAEESSFRYPGPKPQSKEAATLMLADACEGASRSLSEPTPKRLERLVHEIAMKRLLDGQFDECGLTLTEMRTLEDSLTKSLIAMYHGRVKYPEQRPAQELRA